MIKTPVTVEYDDISEPGGFAIRAAPVPGDFNPLLCTQFCCENHANETARILNTHDALVAALDHVVAYHNYHVGGPDWIQQCREALKLAKRE